MDKRFLGILGAIIIIFVGIFAITQNSNSNSSNNNSSGTQATHHVEGQGSAGVTLVEYGDYECPICEAYYQPLKQVASQLNSQIVFQFRNLPLTAIHQNAFAAARAAEAAGLQNKYWQMHDMLYDNQNAWVSRLRAQTFFITCGQVALTQTNSSRIISAVVSDRHHADLAASLPDRWKRQRHANLLLTTGSSSIPSFPDPTTGAL